MFLNHICNMKNYFILLIFSILIISCKKESIPIQLPAITTEGLNTFGCKINNTIITPEGKEGISMSVPAIISDILEHSNDSLKTFRIDIYNKSLDVSVGIKLKLIDLLALKEIKFQPYDFYIHSQNIAFYYDYRNADFQGQNPGFFTSDSLSGKVIVLRADTTNHIMSGTFEFKGIDYRGKVVEIKEGRFDIKYNSNP